MGWELTPRKTRADTCFLKFLKDLANELRENTRKQVYYTILRCRRKQTSARHVQTSVSLDSRVTFKLTSAETRANKYILQSCDALEIEPPRNTYKQVFS